MQKNLPRIIYAQQAIKSIYAFIIQAKEIKQKIIMSNQQ